MGLHLIHLYADSPSEWNCSEWRCKIPSDAVNAEHEAGRTPHTAQLFHLPSALNWRHPEVQKKVGLGDILVFQRNVIVPEVYEAMDYFRAIGKLVLVDLDDHYPGLPPSNPAFAYWIQNKPQLNPDAIAALAEGLRHADALTSPSKTLLEDWAHIVPGCWIPNWPRLKWYKDIQTRPTSAPDLEFGYQESNGQTALTATPRENSKDWIILGWGGSISHVDSWLYSEIAPALDRIFDKHPNVRLKFCGHEGRLNDIMLNRWGDRIVRQPGVLPEHWPIVVGTFDIGLAPLDMRPQSPWREGGPVAAYDERRSWLKAVEYLCAGIPWVASRSRTYAELTQHGNCVENTEEAWFSALDRLVRNILEEKKKAQHKRKWALRRLTMENNVDTMFATYERIMAQRAVQQGSQLPGVMYVVPSNSLAVLQPTAQ